MMMIKSNLAHMIDAYGTLKAQQAELEAEEKALKAALVELTPGAYEGELYRLTISENERETFDKDFQAKIKELIEQHLSRQYISAHTDVKMVRTHRVVGRNGKKVTA